MSVNSVTISGNLTRDADLRETQSGGSVCKFSVAVNERRRNQNGEWEDRANFIDCAMFGKRAEAVSRYLQKGTKVCAAGKLSQNSWTDNGGNKRSSISVVVSEIEFMSRQDKRDDSGTVYGRGDSYEDIPF